MEEKKNKLEAKVDEYWVCMNTGKYLHPIKSYESMDILLKDFKIGKLESGRKYYVLQVIGPYESEKVDNIYK